MPLSDWAKMSPCDWFYDARDQLKTHIYDRSLKAFDAGDAARDALTSPEQVRARQAAIRETFLKGIGGLPSSDTPLEAQTLGVVEGDGFKVEKVIFQSRPGTYVTANLYLPHGLKGPTAAVQFLCGHHRDAKHQPEYQAVCQYLVQAGLVVLAQDPVGQGERFSYILPDGSREDVSWGCPEHDHAGAQCLPLGQAIARYFLHDAMRGIDYLCSRPEVDPARIGLTGNSGGGTQSSLMMMAEPRIAAAVPATFIMDRRSYLFAGGAQDAEQIWPGFSAAGFDHEDIVLAMAPRPVRVLAVTGDFFPIEGTRRTVARCRRIWELMDRPRDLDLVEDQSGHMYTRKLARAAATFFAKHLLGTEPTLDDNRIAPFEPSDLWCTPNGQVRQSIPGARFVFEETAEYLATLHEQRQSIPPEERRRQGLEWLKERVFAHRRPCDLNPRYYAQGQDETLHATFAIWWSHEGIFNHGCLVRPAGLKEPLPVTLAVWDGGLHEMESHAGWIRETCATGRAVLVLEVSGAGNMAPHPITQGDPLAFYGVIHKLADDLIWLDDSLPALRTYDVIRALEMLEQWPGIKAGPLEVCASGRYGLYGRLAALLDSRIGRVIRKDGPTSYAEWVGARLYDSKDIYSIILPGILEHFDLPEVEV